MIFQLAIALIITVIIESVVAFVLGFRNRYFLSAVLLVNVMTNPLINFLVIISNSIMPSAYYFVVFVLEVLVVFSEWKLLEYVSPKQKGLLKLSIVMNVCSFVAGFVLVSFGLI